SIVVVHPAVSARQAAPVRIPLPASAALAGDSFVLVDTASGERFAAQRDGERAVIAVIGPLSGERRFRLETAPAGAAAVTVQPTRPHHVEVRVGGQLLAAYEFDPASARPFFYPLIGPTGQPIT